MTPNVLITGASGFIGGTLLSTLLAANVIPPSNIWAVVRSNTQAEALRALQVKVSQTNLTDSQAVEEIILGNQIDIVIHTASAVDYALAGPLLSALGNRRRQTKLPVHFIHTSGASAFADKSGWSHGLVRETDRLDELQRQTIASYPLRETDVAVHRTADEYGITVYTVVPPLVYGKGTGTWNKLSVQIPTLIRVAIANKLVYRFAEDSEWPAVHVTDLANYYTSLTRRIIEQRPLPSGEGGWYLVSAHSFRWHEILEALAKELFKRELVSSPDPTVWPSEEFSTKALGVPPPFSYIAWNSNSLVLSERHNELGWQPEWDYQRLLREIGEEVEALLQANVNSKTLADLLNQT